MRHIPTNTAPRRPARQNVRTHLLFTMSPNNTRRSQSHTANLLPDPHQSLAARRSFVMYVQNQAPPPNASLRSQGQGPPIVRRASDLKPNGRPSLCEAPVQNQMPGASPKGARREDRHLALSAPATQLPAAPGVGCRAALPLVELIGIEPMTPCLQSRCSPS